MRDFRIWSDSIFPTLRKLHQWGYLRIEAEGLHNIPDREPLVLVANHGGWAALDGLVIPLALSERLAAELFPYCIVEDILCRLPLIGPALERMGSVPRSLARNPGTIPECVENLGIFPEGSEGNCKPFWQAYQMQPWKTGFARLAYARKASILPIAVIGLEESLPVLWKVRALKPLIGTVMPIPLLPVPLPAQCKVIFSAPIDIGAFSPGPEEDPDFYRRVARHCQGVLQAVIDREAADRPLARLARRVRSVTSRAGPRKEPPKVEQSATVRSRKTVPRAVRGQRKHETHLCTHPDFDVYYDESSHIAHAGEHETGAETATRPTPFTRGERSLSRGSRSGLAR